MSILTVTAALHLPVVRGDCLPGGVNASRPCAHRTCRWHLDRERRRMAQVHNSEESCVLDVADRGGVTLEDIADMIGLTRERVRQIEEQALQKVTRIMLRRTA